MEPDEQGVNQPVADEPETPAEVTPEAAETPAE